MTMGKVSHKAHLARKVGRATLAMLMAYGIAVLIGLIAITIASIKIYKVLQPKLIRFERYIPKISTGLLMAMAIMIIFW